MRHLEPEQLKRQIFMATRALVERRLAAGPLVLVVEDLHWADAASIELLRRGRRPARRSSAPGPADVSADARAGRARHEPRPAHRDRGHAAVAVRQRGPAGRVVRRTRRRSSRSTLRELILERAGGNPLYLEEVVRAPGRGGRAGPRRPGVALRPRRPRPRRCPSTLHGLLLARAGPARRRGAPGHPGGGGDRARVRGPAAAGGRGRAGRGGRGARRARLRPTW